MKTRSAVPVDSRRLAEVRRPDNQMRASALDCAGKIDTTSNIPDI
jgi:hypothetical protein